MWIVRRERNMPLVGLALLALLIMAGVINTKRTGGPTAGALDGAATQAGAALNQPGATKTEQQIWSLQARIQRSRNDVDSYALLGTAYVQRAFETGDPSFYTKAEQVLDVALGYDPRHVEALIGAGSLALARHEFAEALKLGEQARSIDPAVPRVYGVIGDAQVELGRYDEAVQTIQTMVDLRPDLASYSRVSYLRELHGDLPGAIMAMQQAVAAGGATPEQTQWVRVQLAQLLFNTNDLAAAEQQYRWALAQVPDYVPALVGLARVRAAQGDYDAAEELYVQVTERMPLPEYIIALGDVYTKQGNREQAQRQYDLVKVTNTLFATNGVNTDLETALFLADHNIDLPATLRQAQAAYQARPNIHAADAIAWTLYKMGRYADAQRYAAEALQLGTRDPLKLFHAGMIAYALGQNEEAANYLQQALDLNPHFSLLWSDLAATTLRQLQQGGAP